MINTTIAKVKLYDRDYLQWVEDIANKLRARDFDHLDIENLIEEIEDLGKSEKKNHEFVYSLPSVRLGRQHKEKNGSIRKAEKHFLR